MKNLKRLGLSFSLIFILAVTAFAGETSAGPCAPPAPGETSAGPCTAAQMTPGDSAAPGGTNSPVASNAGDPTSATELVVDLLLSVLLLF